MGPDLATSLGAPPNALIITGDDALELIPDGRAAAGHALGMSMRVSRYAGVDLAAAKAVGDLVARAAETFGAPVVALPVSRYPVDGDLDALHLLLNPDRSPAGSVLLFAVAANCSGGLNRCGRSSSP